MIFIWFLELITAAVLSLCSFWFFLELSADQMSKISGWKTSFLLIVYNLFIKTYSYVCFKVSESQIICTVFNNWFWIKDSTPVDPWPQNSNTEVALAVCVLCTFYVFVLGLNEKWVGLYFSFCHQNEKCVELSFSHQQCTMFLLLHLHRGVSSAPLRVGIQ